MDGSKAKPIPAYTYEVVLEEQTTSRCTVRVIGADSETDAIRMAKSHSSKDCVVTGVRIHVQSVMRVE